MDDSSSQSELLHVSNDSGEVLPTNTEEEHQVLTTSLRLDEYDQVLVDEPETVNESALSSPDKKETSRGSLLDTLYDINATLSPAKKLTKRLSSLVETVVSVATLDDSRIASPFQNWTRQQLVDLLISCAFELRGEHSISTTSLRELAEEYFRGKPIPAKPPALDLKELAAVEHYVLVVQRRWIEKLARRRQRKPTITRHKYEAEPDDYDYHAHMLTNEGQDNVEVQVPSYELESLPSFGDSLHRLESGEGSVRGRERENSRFSTRSRRVSTLKGRSGSVVSEGESKRSSARVVIDVINRAATLLNLPTMTESKKFIKIAASMYIPKKALELLEKPWVQPDFEKAKLYQAFFHPRKGGKGGEEYSYLNTTTGRHCCQGFLGEQCDIFREGHMSEFAVYGPGVSNYFKFLKWCVGVFAFLAVVSLPCLLLNFYGPYQFNEGLNELVMTTLGNLAKSSSNSSYASDIPACIDYGGFGLDCQISRETVSDVYSWVDICVIIVVMISFIWLKKFEASEEKHLDKKSLYASQYTIMITNLPPTATEYEIRVHIRSAITDFPIARLCVAYDNEKEIELCRERGKFIHKKKRLINEHRHFATQTKLNLSDPSEIEKAISDERLTFFRNIKDIDDCVKQINQELHIESTKDQKPIAAFVTFNNDVASHLVIDQFKAMSIFHYYFGYHAFRMSSAKSNQSYLLHVKRAPEPLTLFWENLKYKRMEQIVRESLSIIISFIMIFCSLLMVLGAKYYTIEFYNHYGTTEQTCPNDFSSLSRDEQRVYVVDTSNLYTHCYCSRLTDYQQAKDALCANYFGERLSSQFFIFFAAMFVVLINQLLEFVIRKTCKFEKHHTEDHQAESIFYRLFVLKYLNTAAIFLVDNNYMILRALYGIDVNSATDFSPQWYNTVGVMVLLVQLGNVIFDHSDKISSYIQYTRRLQILASNTSLSLSQDELNKAHLGPKLRIAYNYAQLLSTIFVCLTFSCGMPILYIIAAANFMAYYMIEKYLFIRCYRNPPRWSILLAMKASTMIPIACILHLCMSIWMITDPSLFPNESRNPWSEYISSSSSGNGIVDRLTQSQSYRLSLCILALIALCVLWSVYSYVQPYVDELLKFIRFVDCFSSKTKELNPFERVKSETLMITYTRAIHRNLIKSLATYNILQHPNYKEDFGITWKFALEHAHVGSIRYDRGGGEDEEDRSKSQRGYKDESGYRGISAHQTSLDRNRDGSNKPQCQVPMVSARWYLTQQNSANQSTNNPFSGVMTLSDTINDSFSFRRWRQSQKVSTTDNVNQVLM